jgi:hypothetical protein
MAGMYLMTGDSDEPFSISYALLGPATNSYLMRHQGITLYGTTAYLFRFHYFDKRMSDFGKFL